MADLTITIAADGSCSPNPGSVKKGGTVNFINNMSGETTISADNGLFPQGMPVTVPPATTSADKTVSAAAVSGKEIHYPDCSGTQAPRKGTIDVSR